MNLIRRAGKKAKKTWKVLGPGLITGSSDDDPSGIATYSQAGAIFGLMTLWTALITFPLMASIQEMCARIGIVTGEGLAGAIKKNYSRSILYVMLAFSFPAIVLNIGADIAGMGAVANLLIPSIPPFAFSILFTALLIPSIIFWPYKKIASIMKYLCLILLVYMVVPFIVNTEWTNAFKFSLLPKFEFSKDYLNILVAILGTTISPYLFIWQASMEVEEIKKKEAGFVVDKQVIRNMRTDIGYGMFYSNLIMYFIILTSGTVLYNAGIRQIDTVDQAALALKPLAGNFSYLLFSLGIIGTGFLAIPVLAGSLSYAMAETFQWEQGLDKKYKEAKPFYAVIAVSLIVGLLIHYIGISPIQALIYTAILYGLTAPVLIVIILLICNNKKILGENVNGFWSNLLGILTFLLMTISGVALIWFYFN
ncbi:MAG: Nramp family divalent metal transporter [Bacteroidetes bacterium]|nr:Nramp family divalent metal transporter [Bacteroidota bacterium]